MSSTIQAYILNIKSHTKHELILFCFVGGMDRGGRGGWQPRGGGDRGPPRGGGWRDR